MGKKSDFGLLHRFSYPPYHIECLGTDDVAVCGGGGAAKTGVPNVVEILQLSLSTNQMLPTVTSLVSHDTSPHAVMHFDVVSFDSYHLLFTAEGNTCQEYHIYSKANITTANGGTTAASGSQVRQRGSNNNVSPPPSKLVTKSESQLYESKAIRKVVIPDSKQSINMVKLSTDCSHFLLGLSNGQVLIYDYTNFTLSSTVTAHVNGEVDCLDVSPTLQRFITASKSDKMAKLWRMDGTVVTELCLIQKTANPYRFKHCLFARRPAEGSRSSSLQLFTTHVPIRRQRVAEPCYLSFWDTTKYSMVKCVSTGVGITSSLAVSSDGCYLGLGTIEGDVSVYLTYSLQRIYQLQEAHQLFVTDISFMSPIVADRSGHDWQLVSISADNLLRWHCAQSQATYSYMVPLLCAMLVLFMLFYFLSELGL